MANILKMAQINTIRCLLGRGWSQRHIARELRIDRKTVVTAYTSCKSENGVTSK